jgi:alpha-galactosidase
MPIYTNTESEIEFHLTNSSISYIMTVLKNGQLGQLYFGKSIKNRDSFQHLLVNRSCVLCPAVFGSDMDFSLETIKQEYPVMGTGDYREEALKIKSEDGSTTNVPVYKKHEIYKGKKKLKDLPSTWAENDDEITTLVITLEDKVQEYEVELSYHLFEEKNVISRSAKITNKGSKTLKIEKALSLSIDFPTDDFDMLTFNGAWSRERRVSSNHLHPGIQKIESLRGASSANHNPSFILKDPSTTELSGSAYGISLIYSGNFEALVQVDHYSTSRAQIGINSNSFEWVLKEGNSFQTPEAIIAFSDQGLNGLSHELHSVITDNIMTSKYRKQPRPLLINNWEATYFDFNEEKLLTLAENAKNIGIELFVLDDGWFGKRNDDTTSLGDWFTNESKLPLGIGHLADEIKKRDLKFGLWFEPEMVNEDSDLFRAHPDWVISTENRSRSFGRNQFVLDYSNVEVVDYIFDKMKKIIDETKLDYIKWDMNRNITEPYGKSLDSEQQGEFFHRYILGVYNLYERLTSSYPDVLFESCASGGARFDLGMMYYAPQAWTSDDTDAVERIKIQYGTSMIYPLCSMGSHVSAAPNHQVGRSTSLKMRGDVAFFGTFGYELDLTKHSEEELSAMKEQIDFFKKHRQLFQYGTFYRLESPFENDGNAAWMVVSEDKKEAVFAYYKVLAMPNAPLKRIKLEGLDDDMEYTINDNSYMGDELKNVGFNLEPGYSGSGAGEYYQGKHNPGKDYGDFTSQLHYVKSK